MAAADRMAAAKIPGGASIAGCITTYMNDIHDRSRVSHNSELKKLPRSKSYIMSGPIKLYYLPLRCASTGDNDLRRELPVCNLSS